MINDFQIKGLNKLVNSGIIKKIYPMVDYINIGYEDTGDDLDRLDIDIHLNNNDITKDNMYQMGFDPHYLIAYHLKNYFPYFNIDNVVINFIVWGPDENIIYSWGP